MSVRKKICPLIDCTELNLEQIDAIFFENSGKNFENEIDRQIFKQKWLSPYFEEGKLFYCIKIDEKVVGYINGDANTENIQDDFTDLLKTFPAHLHINISRDFHGHGLGAELINYFYQVLKRCDLLGVHVVTSPNSRNVKFYERNGHHSTRLSSCQRFLFMGKSLK